MRVFRTRPVIGLAALLAMAFVTAACHPPPSGLVADYKFQDTRASSVGSPPALTDIDDNPNENNVFLNDTVDGVERRVLRFPEGNGLRLKPTTGTVPTNKYTIVILFRFATVSGAGCPSPGTASCYRRILQTTNDAGEQGLYVEDGALMFFGCCADMANGRPGTIPANTYVQVAVKRDSNGVYVGYVNGRAEFFFTDSANYGTIDVGEQLRFFDDNFPDSSESAGRVARIRIWNRALTDDEIAGLHLLT